MRRSGVRFPKAAPLRDTPPVTSRAVTERIEQFFDADGRLISIPARHGKRRAVLQRIASGIAGGTRYSEKALNAHIAQFHDDTAAIRRYMIEEGILKRDNATSTYWLADAKGSE